MKKISIIALVLILAAALTGCWRRSQEPTTMPSTVGPTTQATKPNSTPTTEPSVPTTNGTVPYPSGSTAPTTEGMMPGTDATSGYNDDSTAPTEQNAGNQARRMPRY